jgi:glycosyltransferase involved in cell wall biosynthesis
MKIQIDTAPVLPQLSGIGFYVVQLLEELTQLGLTENFRIEPIYQVSLKSIIKGNFSAPTRLRRYPDLRYFPLPVKVTNLFIQYPKLFFPWIEHSFGKADIFHGTNYTVFPFRTRRKVLTIYDLTFIKYPQFSDRITRAYAERVRRCLTWTDLVLTISESSKQDIVEYLGMPADRVIVTPLASRYGLNYPIAANPSIPFDFQKPYLLFVSTIEPRKNILGLIAAFDYLKQTYRIEHELVLIGQMGWSYEPILQRIHHSPYRQAIHHLNYVSDESVAAFYQKADVFVYPSHYEGFGLPVLEAMTLGTPVVCSNRASLPEVAGDAAILVDSQDSLAIAEGIWRVISDRTLRADLIHKGRVQAQQFSWQRTAWQTLQAYQLLA